jgi:hypothetical protein
MPKAVRKARPAPVQPTAAAEPAGIQIPANVRPFLGPAILVLVTLACYWVPLTSGQVSILWDAADYHRAVQDYMSTELHAGRLPFWSPYPWTGYPFMADPQVGAWYPPNWPFFLIGVTSRVLFVEHWIHAMWACFGAYFLARRLLRSVPAAVVAGLCYGLSGFIVANNSHTGVLQTASWTPWLVLLLERALEKNTVRNAVLGGLAAGMMILAGHFQTSLYSFVALGLWAAARVLGNRRQWLRIFGVALAIPVAGALISAIGTVPGLELTAASTRASLKAIDRPEGVLPPEAVATLVEPNYYGGILSGEYHGPFEMTQYYYYSGILMLPLALLGLRHRSLRWSALLLTVPPIWYALGASAGLYQVIARLPGFSSVRAPVNMWIVVALELPILAAAGLVELGKLWPAKWLPAAIVLIFSVDLFYVQSGNHLVYAQVSYQDLYGSRQDRFQQAMTTRLAPLTRFDGPDIFTGLGPLSHFLSLRTEVTYGYSPLKLQRYTDYIDAMKINPALRNGLNVAWWLDVPTGSLRPNPRPLPRVTFPAQLVTVESPEASKQALTALDQWRQALVPAGRVASAQDANGVAQVREFTPGHYKIHYRCATPSVMRIGSAWYPGWHGVVDGQSVEIFPVDHALTGVAVPAGEYDLDLDYHSRFFLAGLLLTLLTLGGCAVLCFRPRPLLTSAAAKDAT